VKALELLDMEAQLDGHFPHSTLDLRERVRDGEHLHPDQILGYLKGPEMDWVSQLFPPTSLSGEDLWIQESRRLAKLMADLRRMTFRFYRSYEVSSGYSEMALVLREEDVEADYVAQQWEDEAGMPWLVTTNASFEDSKPLI
jgi:hypothetical protein